VAWHLFPGFAGSTALSEQQTLSGDEDEDHRDDEREQTEKLGSRETDEQATLLTICRTRIAQSAFKERAKHIAHAQGSHSSTNGSQTGTNELCSFCVHIN
jgi:hypothetical protein